MQPIIQGQKFNRWTAIKQIGKNKRGRKTWLFQCDCGSQLISEPYYVTGGHTKSCGCLKNKLISQSNKTHGQTSSRLYGIWRGMKSRCYNAHTKDFSYYGAKGIKVCDEWKQSFEHFKDWAFANGYSDDLTLDRIDGMKDYCPTNCRWVDRKTQSRNLSSNVVLTIYGISKTITEWSETCGIDRHTIRKRLDRGWDAEKALITVPTNCKKERKEMIKRKIEALMLQKESE